MATVRTAEQTARERAQRRKSKLCHYCNDKVEPGRSMCAKHLEYNRNYVREFTKRKNQ